MESYDVFLMGNFLALPAFTKDYGVWNEVKQEYVVAPAWQSALQGQFQLFPFFDFSTFSTFSLSHLYPTNHSILNSMLTTFSLWPTRCSHRCLRRWPVDKPHRIPLRHSHRIDAPERLHLLFLLRQLPSRYVRCAALRGHPMGHIHCKCACRSYTRQIYAFTIFFRLTPILVLLRDRAHPAPRPCDSDVADVLGHWQHHRRRRDLPLQHLRG